ncbi:MAG: hypothetical protein ACK578_06925, partial [Pirellula sp.]
RIRLAPSANQPYLTNMLANQSKLPFGGHPMTKVDGKLIGDQVYDGLIGRASQTNGYCNVALAKRMDMSMARMSLGLLEELELQESAPAKTEDKKP